MFYPKLYPIPSERQLIDTFRGYNHNLRIGAGEFYHMENFSSHRYPVLSPRNTRGIYARPASPQGIIAKEKLCYVDGADFVIGDERYALDLSTDPARCPKQLVSMGAYVIILPDKIYINTADPGDCGHMDAAFTVQTGAKLSLCQADGTALDPDFVQSDAPQAPANGAYWLDTSQSPGSLKQWSQAAGMWASVTASCVSITAPGIGDAFSLYDGVNLQGLPEELGNFAVILAKGADFIAFAGLLQEPKTLETPVTVTRKSPEMDFAVESGNRLWGCRFGPDENGEMVNRLYASRLGDFKNFSCFLGLSADSYYVNLGSDGPFTGAVNYLGQPLFFKENCLHKVYGGVPAAFQVEDTPCRGVQPGCHRSIAIVGETLCYKSRSAVCAYDGALPREISYPLGDQIFRVAVAGTIGSKYYISMEGEDGWHLFVYDLARSLWHREDGFQAMGFASFEGQLYAIDAHGRNILTMLGGEGYEEAVTWAAETGDLALSSPAMHYISRITLRVSMAMGSKLEIFAQYDESGIWEQLATVRGCSLRSFSVPVRPRRCDHLRLKFQGRGEMKLYALAKTVEKGSDLSR